MKRRTFSKALISSIGLSAIGDKVLFASPGHINASGNNWSAKGLKLGISHQRPDELHEKHINYLKQMGVEYLEIRIPRIFSSTKAFRNAMEISDHSPYSGLSSLTMYQSVKTVRRDLKREKSIFLDILGH